MILLQPHSSTPGVSGGRSPSLPPLEKKETDGDQLDHPYIKNCQIYNYLTKVELLFYFWSLQREQNMLGGRRGSLRCQGGSSAGATSMPGQGHSRQDVALPVSFSPAGMPEVCPHHGEGTDPVSGIPPMPGGWHHRDGGHCALLPCQFSPDPVGLPGCPL